MADCLCKSGKNYGLGLGLEGLGIGLVVDICHSNVSATPIVAYRPLR